MKVAPSSNVKSWERGGGEKSFQDRGGGSVKSQDHGDDAKRFRDHGGGMERRKGRDSDANMIPKYRGRQGGGSPSQMNPEDPQKGKARKRKGGQEKGRGR